MRNLFGLAPGGGYQALPVARQAGGLLPRHFTLTPLARGGIFSVALSLGSPPVAVSDLPALRCPDFPLRSSSGRPAPSVLSRLLKKSICFVVFVAHSVRRVRLIPRFSTPRGLDFEQPDKSRVFQLPVKSLTLGLKGPYAHLWPRSRARRPSSSLPCRRARPYVP